MLDIERIKSDSRGRWNGIFHELGIEVGIGKHQPCPYCQGRDRFRFTDKDGLGGWYCNQCEPHAGDGFALVQKCLGIGFIDAVKKVSDLLGEVEMEFKLNKPKKDPSVYLNRIWRESEPLTGKDPVNKYLQSRGIPFMPDAVRYCPECYESDTKRFYQAMVSRITSRDGKPIGLHITYLKDGKKADVPSPKKTMTPTESLEGSAIRLIPLDAFDIGTIGIAEGIETALSATKLFRIATWSCVSAGLMEKWTPPDRCENIIIFGDSDYSFTGQKSAYILANKLHKKYRVEVKMPPEFGDFNDILKSNIQK